MGLKYNPKSAESIWQYSAGLIGHTLRDFTKEGYEIQAGKGQLGNMVEELFFGQANNNRAEADFHDAGMELKCTPLKKNSKAALAIKERLVCNMIDYCKVIDEPFFESHFYTKCQLMLILFYLHVKDEDSLDLEFLISLLWKFPSKDLAIIQHDYEVIVDKVKAGLAHELSEGDTLYLGACRKGQKGDPLRKQPKSDIGAPKRAFCLKTSYMRIVLDAVLATGKNHVNMVNPELSSLVDIDQIKTKSFDSILLGRFQDYLGKGYLQIAKDLEINLSNNPKSKFSIIANAIASEKKMSNINLSEEFQKSGLMMKTIRVNADDSITEAMAFENIDYQEVYENDDWFESRLYEIFSNRFFFVVFKEQHKGQRDFVLDKVFFWTMPADDLEIAETYWEHIRKNVLDNHVDHQYFWKGKDNRCFHVRPKAQKATDRVPNPLGEGYEPCKKFCYWFNNNYVRKIVSDN